MRILSLDIGRNKTGVAVCSGPLEIVTPLRPLLCPMDETGQEWFEGLMKLMEGYSYTMGEIGVVVMGSWKDKEHRNMEMKGLVKRAMSIIKERTPWEIVLVREAYTTVESREILKGLGVKRKRINRSTDSYAASLLLIDYLELVRPNQNNGRVR